MDPFENSMYKIAQEFLDKLTPEERATMYFESFLRTIAVVVTYADYAKRLLEYATNISPILQSATQDTLDKFLDEMEQHIKEIVPPVV
jgi:hypothetical protein